MKRLIILIAFAMGLLATSGSAQCVKHPDGKTALIFDNASIYRVTFYVDNDEMTIQEPHTTSREFAVTAGEHLLSAKAEKPQGDLWLRTTNEVPEGCLCTLQITGSGTDEEAKVSFRR